MTHAPSDYLDRMSSAFDEAARAATSRLAGDVGAARSRGARVFLAGNGGSAANANHWANDLLYGAGKTGRGGVRAHSLSANLPVLTCLANDTGYDNVFAGQLRVHASSGDLLIVMSGSGNSPNILRVLDEARALGVRSWALLGFDGGRALGLADEVVHFRIHDMQVAEDLQMVVCHIVTAQLAAPES